MQGRYHKLTLDELYALQKQKEIEAEQRKKAQNDTLIAKQKQDLEANKVTAEQNLAESNLKEQGNIGYQGAKAQMQGSILDNYSGFGSDTGAGIQRQDVRTMATNSRLANLDTAYTKAKGDLNTEYLKNQNNLDFQGNQANQTLENTIADIEAKYSNALANAKFQEAEQIRKEKEAEIKAAEIKKQQDEIARQNEAIKYESDVADNVYNFINANAKDDTGVFSQSKANQILANAQAKYGFSNATLEKLKAKIGDYSTEQTRTDNFNSLDNDLMKTQVEYNNNSHGFLGAVDYMKYSERIPIMIEKVKADLLSGKITDEQADALAKKYGLV